MSFELLETIQVTQKELPPKLASRVLKAQHISSYNYHNLITLGKVTQRKKQSRGTTPAGGEQLEASLRQGI